jgi:MFS family permease
MQTAERPRTRLPRNVILLGVVSFFADVSSEMAYPFIPIFLTGVLGAPVAAVGAIEGIAESTASLMKLASGWWSDRVHRRVPLVIAGYGLAAVAKVLLALAAAWPFVLFARFVDRFGKGLRGSPRDALIGDSAPPELRGRAFGLHRSMDTAGAVLGPLLALAMASALNDDLRTVFLIAAIPGFLGVLALFLVREPRRIERSAASTAPSEALPIVGRMPRPLLLFIAASLVFALGNSSDVFLLLRARDLGMSTTLVVLAYVVYNFVYMLGAYPIGILSDRIGRRGVFVAGLAAFALTYLGFALITSQTLVWPLFALYGLYMAATDGVGKALITDIAPTERRASAIGLHGMITGLGTLAASVLAGQLWDHVSPAAPFLLGAVSAVLALMLLLAAMPARTTARAR